MDFQCADPGAYVPSKNMLQRWANAALETQDLEQSELELVVRVVDELESAELNDKFRGKANPTNAFIRKMELALGVKLPRAIIQKDKI